MNQAANGLSEGYALAAQTSGTLFKIMALNISSNN